MKHLLLTTIAAVVLVGCGESQPPEPPTAKAPDISIWDAAARGNIEAVKQHLAAGADVNVWTGRIQTPLHFAVRNDRKEIVELLIAKGAEVNVKSASGFTPLHSAASRGNKEIVELLIAEGASVNARLLSGYYQGFAPVDLAESKGHKEIADLLRKHSGKTAAELKGGEPVAKAPDISIHDAAEDGNIETVKQHIAAGTDVNAKNDDGETPLDVAFLYDETETADPLRKHGGEHGTIHGAARGGDIEVVKEFLATGTDVNAKSSWNGSTPLHHAAEYGHKEVAELLIAEGADVNAPAKYGLTPLDVAIQSSTFLKGHPEIADLLRKHGGKTKKELEAGN